MLKKIIVFGMTAILSYGCTSSIEKHISEQPKMAAEKKEALRKKEVSLGMTSQELILLLGEPQLKEKLDGLDLWRYTKMPKDAGISRQDSYTPESSFAQGVAFVVPLNYGCQEIVMLLEKNQIVRIEKIIQRAPPPLPGQQKSDEKSN